VNEIKKEDYILTNLNPSLGCFTIRLSDGKEYKVYKDESKKYYIKKDKEKYYLDKYVKRCFDSECNVYNDCGI